jgi:uncharacterized membrane protein (DUF4010 family)
VEIDPALRGLLTALGIGLLIGTVRERAHVNSVAKAGIRTHALLALLGVMTWELGIAAFVATLFAIGALAVIGYLNTADTDPGMTGEVAILSTFVLGGLAHDQRVLASALGVVIAILLHVKKPLQHLTRERMSEDELNDALILAAAAVVLWPLMPQQPLDPWGVLDLNMIWRLVVLVMAVGMLGHIAQRVAGIRLGMPIAGFFSGFVSSTLAVASLGSQVKEAPALTAAASAGALLANLASLILMSAVLATIAPALLHSMIFVLLASGVALVLAALLCWLNDKHHQTLAESVPTRAFKLTQALSVALVIAGVVMLTAWLREHFGETGALITAGLAALVELHAAAASLAQLNALGALELSAAQRGVLIVMATASIAKSVLAFFSGGLRYGLYVAGGLFVMMAAASLVMLAH